MHSPSQLLSTGHKQKREKSCNIHSPSLAVAYCCAESDTYCVSKRIGSEILTELKTIWPLILVLNTEIETKLLVRRQSVCNYLGREALPCLCFIVLFSKESLSLGGGGRG